MNPSHSPAENSPSSSSSEPSAGSEQALAEARSLFERAMTLADAVLAADSPDTAALGDAVAMLQRAAILAPGKIPILYNLGNLLVEVDNVQQAAAVYHEAFKLDPADPDIAVRLGKSLHQIGQTRDALMVLEHAARGTPDSFEAASELAKVLDSLDKYRLSIPWHQQALAIDPTNAPQQWAYARALATSGNLEAAATALVRMIELDPRCSSAYELLGQLYSSTGQNSRLPELGRKWLEHCPDQPTARHLAASWTGEAVEKRASDAFVQEVFDHFAPEFDATLERLEYQAPQHVAAAAREFLATLPGSPAKFGSILDAGCGTGLCGPLVRPIADLLIGVDLSSGMIEQAKLRVVYDALKVAELTGYLLQCDATFDLVISADTLVYFGDLREVLEATASRLSPGGGLIITLESAVAGEVCETFVLRAHGRYAHAREYVEQTLATTGLQLVSLGEVSLRKQAQQPVAGYLVVARRRP